MTAQLGMGNNRDDRVMDNQEEGLQFERVPSIPDEPDETWWAAVLLDEPVLEEQDEGIEPLVFDNTKPRVVNHMPSSVNWDKVNNLFKRDEIITLAVVSYNRGGILVEDKDIYGFVPASHLIDLPNNISEDEREQYLISYLDRKIPLKVIECEPKRERIVFSERAALAGAGQRRELLHSLTEGDIINGKVTNITSFGAFVDLGGLEGLIHVSELSWGRVQHPSMILEVGQDIKAMVIEVFEEQGRIALSLKRLEKNPWNMLSKKLSPGDVIEAEISSIVKYGAFARLEEGIEGLIHISTMTFPEDCTQLDEFLFEGQPVKVGVINIEAEKRRLSLKLEGIN